MRPIVFVPEEIASQGIKLLQADCDVVAPWMTGSPVEPAMIEVADGVIVRLFKIGQTELDSAVRLKVIAKHGVGLDNIAVDLALARGLCVVEHADGKYERGGRAYGGIDAGFGTTDRACGARDQTRTLQ